MQHEHSWMNEVPAPAELYFHSLLPEMVGLLCIASTVKNVGCKSNFLKLLTFFLVRRTKISFQI